MISVGLLVRKNRRAKFLLFGQKISLVAAQQQRKTFLEMIFPLESVANIGLIHKQLIHRPIQTIQQVFPVCADGKPIILPVEHGVSVLRAIVKKHGVNITVNVAAIVSINDFLISLVAREGVLKTFRACNFIKSRRVVIGADACKIYVRLNLIGGDDKFHRKTSDDVSG